MPRRILINTCYGGYTLSDEARTKYREAIKSLPEPPGLDDYFDEDSVPRDDPLLLQVVDEIGLANASGAFANLAIVEIPDDVTEYMIEEYDGQEWVSEKHRRWYA